MLIIDEATGLELLDMPEAIRRQADALRAMSSGHSTVLRGQMRDPDRPARGLLLAGYIGGLQQVCLKFVGTFEGGRRASVILLMNTATGQPEAMVTGSFITDYRTGAVSGAATDCLARADSRHLGVLGTGRQAITQVQAMLAVRPIEQVTVWNRTPERAAVWVENMRRLLAGGNPPVPVPAFRMAASPAAACAEADIVIVSTSAQEPVLRGEWLQPGTHVNAVGAGAPVQQELHESVFQRSNLITVDGRDIAFATGDFSGPLQRGTVQAERVAEMGEVLLGLRSGRSAPEQITLFKSVGHAANDVAVVQMMAERAGRVGKGLRVDLAWYRATEGATP